MISQMVMVVLRRVHNDGGPAMGPVRIWMHEIRFGVVIRSSGMGARGNSECRAKTKYPER